MKALVVRLSAIGDVVHTLPVVAALRQAYRALTAMADGLEARLGVE